MVRGGWLLDAGSWGEVKMLLIMLLVGLGTGIVCGALAIKLDTYRHVRALRQIAESHEIRPRPKQFEILWTRTFSGGSRRIASSLAHELSELGSRHCLVSVRAALSDLATYNGQQQFEGPAARVAGDILAVLGPLLELGLVTQLHVQVQSYSPEPQVEQVLVLLDDDMVARLPDEALAAAWEVNGPPSLPVSIPSEWAPSWTAPKTVR